MFVKGSPLRFEGWKTTVSNYTTSMNIMATSATSPVICLVNWWSRSVEAVITELGDLSTAKLVTYPLSQIKQDILPLPITSPNTDRFSKFFHCQTCSTCTMK